MKKFIELMPQREDDYYEWVVNHPITRWKAPTYILRPEVDLIVSKETGRDFISQHQCQVTIMPNGEHWFHTPEQLAFLKAWEEKIVSVRPILMVACHNLGRYPQLPISELW